MAFNKYPVATGGGGGGLPETPLAVIHGGSNSTTAAGARTNFGAAESGANSSITSLTGLTTAISKKGTTKSTVFLSGGGLYQIQPDDEIIQTDGAGNAYIFNMPLASLETPGSYLIFINGGDTTTFPGFTATLDGATIANGTLENPFTLCAVEIVQYNSSTWVVQSITPQGRQANLSSTGANSNITQATGLQVINTGEPLQIFGGLQLNTAGDKITIKGGTDAAIGTGTLVGGTLSISTAAVTPSSLVIVTATSSGTNSGTLAVTAQSAGSFTVTSSNVLDTATFNWLIVEPQ